MTNQNEEYIPAKKAMNIDIKAEVKIKGAVLLVAMSLSIPNSSQTGIRRIEPPIPSIPPIHPAAKPIKRALLKYFKLTLSSSFLKTNPSYSFLISPNRCLINMYLVYR